MKRKRNDDAPQVRLLSGGPEWNPGEHLKVTRVVAPAQAASLGAVGQAVRITGARSFADTTLVIPVARRDLSGIDQRTVRVFRVDGGGADVIGASGLNAELGYAWARIRRPGTFAVIGAPRDRLLQALLREVSRRRDELDDDDTAALIRATESVIAEFLALPEGEVEELRDLLTRVEGATAAAPAAPDDRRAGEGGHLAAYPLPRGMSLRELREELPRLARHALGFPERVLLEPDRDLPQLPWPVWPGAGAPQRWIDPSVLHDLDLRLDGLLCRWFPWFCSQDWWMYQHDHQHTGHASGYSNLRQSTVGRLYQQSKVNVDGVVISKPSIVDGKLYIGTSDHDGTPGGSLYKIDVASGVVEGRFITSGSAFYPYKGIGGSPAVSGGRVYICNLGGRVYCIDAATMSNASPPPPPLWVTDLRTASQAKNQPVNQPNADSWSGPLVVGDRVYVGSGEGESAGTYGVVFCLDANDGHVIWLFVTSKRQNVTGPGMDNLPNEIPAAIASTGAWVAASGYTVVNDPNWRSGCSVWSSFAYDATLNRVYVGTGNSEYGGATNTAAPDNFYGSGLIALDATTGEFRGFFAPQPDDSYWPGDSDIDVPGSPTLFTWNGRRTLAFGSKSGACFLLDPDTLAPYARRQMLPRKNGSGLAGDRGTGVDAVVPTGGQGENPYGIFGTPAFDGAHGRLFVGLGGYHGLTLDVGTGINPTSTPFMRAVSAADLTDAWPTALGADGITRYTTVTPPMYLTREVGLGSPAVVNDVVLMATGATPYESPPLAAGLYALAADTGVCLWKAPNMPTDVFVLGPAVYGNYVAIGAGTAVYIYTLFNWHIPWQYLRLMEIYWLLHGWPPPPPPPPDGGDIDPPPWTGPVA